MSRARFSTNKPGNRMNSRLFSRPIRPGKATHTHVTLSVRNLLRRLGLPMVCVAMFSLVGGHWAIFQTIAWTQMLRDYSRNASLAEAVEKTFSGKAPCAMCCSIAEEKQKEEKAPATLKVDKKAEVFVARAASPLPDPTVTTFSYRFPADMTFSLRPSQPADPVPIGTV